uniref:Clathrin light chain n=1 Tax=Ditylenchus dipsaci TaxID=166011 RepID=A0A915E2Y2_9BILA
MSDPVSEFLAREHDALANLDGDDDDFAAAPYRLLPLLFLALDINEPAPSPFQNGRGPSPASINSGRGGSNGPYVEKEEPEKIRKWRENQKEMIAEKDKAEEKKKEELREHAKKELQELHAQRKAKLEQRKKENREREEQLDKYDTPTANGESIDKSWERIAKMIEAGSKTRSASTKDTSRMKGLILSYRGKNEVNGD